VVANLDKSMWRVDVTFVAQVGEGGCLLGFLKKLCPKNYIGKEIWQERFCVFRPANSGSNQCSSFCYWRGTNTRRPPAGTLLCRHMEVVAASPSEGIGRFNIVMEGNRLFKFEALTNEDALRWVKALRTAGIEDRKRRESGNSTDNSITQQHPSKLAVPQGKYWKKHDLNSSMTFKLKRVPLPPFNPKKEDFKDSNSSYSSFGTSTTEYSNR